MARDKIIDKAKDRVEKYAEKRAGARVGQVAEALFEHDLDIGCSCLTRNPAQLGESERGRSNAPAAITPGHCGCTMRSVERSA